MKDCDECDPEARKEFEELCDYYHSKLRKTLMKAFEKKGNGPLHIGAANRACLKLIASGMNLLAIAGDFEHAEKIDMVEVHLNQLFEMLDFVDMRMIDSAQFEEKMH